MNREDGHQGEFFKAFVLAIILNSVLFLSLPFLNKVRTGVITVIKKYPVSLYRLEAKEPKVVSKREERPKLNRIERPKRIEPTKQEKPKGEESPPLPMAPIMETEEVSAYEADVLNQPVVASSHPEGEPLAEEVEEEVEKESPPIYDISELDKPLRLLEYELPAYPPLAQKTGIKAVLLFRLLINEKGLVEKIELLESNVGDELGFHQEAKKAIKNWRFSKPQINGKGVSVFYILPLKFIPE